MNRFANAGPKPGAGLFDEPSARPERRAPHVVYLITAAGHNHGTFDVLGWCADPQRAAAMANSWEWARYRAALQRSKERPGFGKLLSPDETDYRHFSVIPAPQLDHPQAPPALTVEHGDVTITATGEAPCKRS